MEHFEQIMREELRDIRTDIKELRHEITKYKGFIGGVIWTFAAVSTAAHFLINWLKGFIS